MSVINAHTTNTARCTHQVSPTNSSIPGIYERAPACVNKKIEDTIKILGLHTKLNIVSLLFHYDKIN